jgi:hypothetical protein
MEAHDAGAGAGVGAAIIRNVGYEAVQRDHRRGRRGRRSRGGENAGSWRGAGLGHQRGGGATVRRRDIGRGVMLTPGRK